MEKEIKSPITGGRAILQKKKEEVHYRKEPFTVVQRFYWCEDTGEEFTTEEQDQVNIKLIYDQYREKHGLPFPEEIREIREKYRLSARKMSQILGFGTNNYRLYEQGEVPSISNGRYIHIAKDPEEFKKLLEYAKEELGEKEYAKTLQEVERVIEEEANEGAEQDRAVFSWIFGQERPNHWTGYKIPDPERTAQLISYLAEKVSEGEVFTTKLNKLLFYCDFLHFKKTGISITGNSYQAIQKGPVPAHYEDLYNKLYDEGILNFREEAYENGIYGKAWSGSDHPDPDVFTDPEKAVIQEVLEGYGELPIPEVVRLSHEEEAWKQCHKDKRLISYLEWGFEVGEGTA